MIEITIAIGRTTILSNCKPGLESSTVISFEEIVSLIIRRMLDNASSEVNVMP